MCAGATLAAFAGASHKPAQPTFDPAASHRLERQAPKLDIYIDTFVTGYNTVPQQTDDTPCIAASGADICGRTNTVACPPLLELGAVVEIDGKKYICEDRTAPKFRNRFDINCDKDVKCPYRVAGWKLVKVISK